jgi:hypothetical protein
MSVPWDRMNGEGEGAYQAFLVYRDLGSDRTQEATRKTLGKRSGYLRVIETWTARWSWAERARAWDSYILAERDKVTAAEARKWEQRRLAAREANFGLAEKLQERVQKLLEMPTVQKRSTVVGEDGRTTITVWEPARWAQRDLATMAKIASDLGEVAMYSLEERNARQIVASVTTHVADADRDRSEFDAILSAGLNRGGVAPTPGDHRAGQSGRAGDNGVAGPMGPGPAPGDAEPEAG